MNNLTTATLVVGLAAVLGWVWRIADAAGVPVAPFGFLAEMLMIVWLWRFLERKDRP